MTGTGAGGFGVSASTEVGRQWLQRWVTAGVVSVPLAQSIDAYEAQRGMHAYVADPLLDGSVPSDLSDIVASWTFRWVAAQLITDAQRTAIYNDVHGVVAAPTAPQWTPQAPEPPQAPGAPAYAAPAATPQGYPLPTGQPLAPGQPGLARPGTAVPTGPKSSGLAVLSEILGYSGAALAIGGSIYLMRNAWPTLPGAVQLIIAVFGVLLFGGLGALIKTDEIPAFARLRAVVWLTATVIGGGVGAVIAYQLYDPLPVRNGLFFVALCSAIVSAALWAWARHPLQEVTFLGGVLVAIAAGMYMVGPIGLAGCILWLAAVALIVLGIFRWFPVPMVPLAMGAIALPIGLILIAVGDVASGLLFACANALTLLVLAFLKTGLSRDEHRVVLGVTGFAVAAVAVPGTMGYFGEQAPVPTGMGLVIVGIIVLACSLAGIFRDHDAVDVLSVIGIGAGIMMFAGQSTDVVPNVGLALSVGLVVLGIRMHRTGLTVISWISVAIFGLLEIAWIGSKVNVGAMFAVIAGAVVVAVAVFLSRKASRNAGGPPSAA